MAFHHVLDYAMLAFGFGFVIFFHELGHFLAAKYCGVKVEQFAVGFGPAIFSWRKGMGLRWGSSGRELEDLHRRAADGAAEDLSEVGETEYRLNYVPLGGYVKMLGQDDLRPNAAIDDPRSYNSKSIGKRMIIVSAGVIMNVILAAIGFMIVFRLGYPLPPAIVGTTYSRSPAMDAVRADGTHVALQPGDQILSYNGKLTNNDFSKIMLSVALTSEGDTVPIEVRHVDGTTETLRVTPRHMDDEGKGVLVLGVMPPSELRGLDPADISDWDEQKLRQSEPADFFAVRSGDVITQINGQDVERDDFWKLSDALAKSDGNPITLTVKSPSGAITQPTIMPHMMGGFSKDGLDFLGMLPRAAVDSIMDKSTALGKLMADDVIIHVEGATDGVSDPTVGELHDVLASAGDKQMPVSLTVLRAGSDQPIVISNLLPNVSVGDGKTGLGIGLREDEQHLVVGQVKPNSSAYGLIPDRATLTAINGKPVTNWFQVRSIIAAASSGDTLAVTYLPHDETKPQVANIKLTSDDIADARQISFTDALVLHEMPGTRKTTNPITAFVWGVDETRDLILQFYVTLQRMFTGTISYKNAMGPVGMITTGGQIAAKGTTWLLWYLSMISANLAVVNFLPIPIVDGGLFSLLILEKIQGKPLSPDAQKIVQMVGLALILGVFLLVTYQDIARAAGY